jgi:hypothetical protein
VSYADTRVTALDDIILQLGPWITNVQDYEKDLVDKRAYDGEAVLWKSGGKKSSATPRSARDRKKAFTGLKEGAQTIFEGVDDVHVLSGIGIQYKEKVQHASDPSALTTVAVTTLFRLETLRNNWLNIIEYVNCAGDLAAFVTPEWVCNVKPRAKEEDSAEEEDSVESDEDYDTGDEDDDDDDDGGQDGEEAEKDEDDASDKDGPEDPSSDSKKGVKDQKRGSRRRPDSENDKKRPKTVCLRQNGEGNNVKLPGCIADLRQISTAMKDAPHACGPICKAQGCLNLPGVGPLHVREGQSKQNEGTVKRCEVVFIKRRPDETKAPRQGKTVDVVYIVRALGDHRYKLPCADGTASDSYYDLALELVFRQLGFCISTSQLHQVSCKRTDIQRDKKRVPLKTARFLVTLTEEQLEMIPEGL